MSDVVHLHGVRAERRPADVVITVSAWWLPETRQWYWRPDWVSEIGVPTATSKRRFADMLRETARDLDRMAGVEIRTGGRQVKARRRRVRR